MFVLTASVLSVVGRIPSLIGETYRLRVVIDDFGEMAGVIRYPEFPVAILTVPDFIGVHLECVIRGSGDRRHAYILPLNNQSPKATGPILGKCMNLIHQSSYSELQELGIAPKIGEELPPDPRVERLESILNADDAVPWDRRQWEAEQLEEAERLAREEEENDPRLKGD